MSVVNIPLTQAEQQSKHPPRIPSHFHNLQVDLSILPRGFQERDVNPRVNEGGKKRRGSLPSLNSSSVSSSVATTLVPDFAPPSSGRGRRRGAKRSLVYAGLAAYNAHFASLVVMELKHEKVGASLPWILVDGDGAGDGVGFNRWCLRYLVVFVSYVGPSAYSFACEPS